MNEISDRTPVVIAAEINSIKDQTQKMLLVSSIEIGRRLVEAKDMLPHGEWGNWLEKSVDYSQSTANNSMRIFEEYGTNNQLSLFDSSSNSQALGNLSYTQAVALLGIPKWEREQFVQDHDIENMSTRELQQAIKERDQALKQAEELSKSLSKANKQINEVTEEKVKLLEEKGKTEEVLKDTETTMLKLQETLIQERRQAKANVDKLTNELREAVANGSTDELIEQLQSELKYAQSQVQTLTEELNKPVEVTAAPIIERVPEEVERELEELRKKVLEFETQPQKPNEPDDPALVEFKVHFNSLVKGFDSLLKVLAEINDQEKREVRKVAVNKLIGMMQGRL